MRDRRWSVLLPTHDAPGTLAASVDSVLAQTDPDLEVLLVADGATDATRRVIEGIADPRVRLFDLPKADGYGYASRRAALEAARGRFVAFASDDDLWAPHHLMRLGARLDAGAALVHSMSTWVIPDGSVVPLPFALDDPGLHDTFRRSNHIPSTCFAVTAEALATAGGWPVHVPDSADWTLWSAILDADLPLATVRGVTALHFRSPHRTIDHPVVDAVVAMHDREGWSGPRITPRPGEPLQVAAVAAGAAPSWWDDLDARLAQVVTRTAFLGAGAWTALAEHRRALDAARDALADQDRLYRSSASWRFTAPARAATSAVRRLRRR